MIRPAQMFGYPSVFEKRLSHHRTGALDRDRAVYVVKADARPAGSDLAAQVVAYIWTVFDRQSEIVRYGPVHRAGFDVGARAPRNDQHDRAVDRIQRDFLRALERG